MTKVWEEIWEQQTGGRVVVIEVQVTESTPPRAQGERTRLAACAPEAVRLLLALDDKTKPCPSCANNRHGSDHDPDCELDALLRKAGVR